ncbi:DNA repair protein [Chitinolyticbacter meiyuanensis]|uniref:DNA repair protein n=1 Tax=Chitinolyticbacter meiyuanensis TaxID=682798 RepID=UPI0011E5D165|nr:DNA repair protein [Chitinolyticbacter meiyuanensis]
MRAALPLAIPLLALLLANPCHADSMEERLRAQLRATSAQLAQLQAEQARLLADKAAAEQARDAARAELAKRSAAPANQADRAAARQAQAAARDAQAELERVRSERDTLKAEAGRQQQDSQAGRQEQARLQGEVTQRVAQLDACTARNARLYAVGKDILAAYERIDFDTVLAARQPFADRSRVRLEEAAQAFGDQLYEARFDPRQAPAAASATTPLPSP